MEIQLKWLMKHYVLLMFLCMIQIFIGGALWTFYSYDNSWFYHATVPQPYHNVFGFFGAHCASLLIYLFGSAAIFIPWCYTYLIALYYYGITYKKIDMHAEWDRAFGVIVWLFFSAMMFQIYGFVQYNFGYPGGIVGFYLVSHFLYPFDLITQKIIMYILCLVSFILATRGLFINALLYGYFILVYCCDTQKTPAKVVMRCYIFIQAFIGVVYALLSRMYQILSGAVLKNLDISIVEFEREKNIDQEIQDVVEDVFWDDYVHNHVQKQGRVVVMYDQLGADQQESSKVEKTLFEERVDLHNQHEELGFISEREQKKTHTQKPDVIPVLSPVRPVEQTSRYELPVVAAPKIEQKSLQEKQEILAMQARLLEEKLEQFDIKGAVVAMHAGPVVTLFEYQPDIKVKVSRILALEDDLAMALKALSIRIIAPIPGRSVVGFEVANQHRQDVVMSRILHAPEFKNYKGSLPMILGQDTLGANIVADLAKMPHLLIAGSTGSGKSVGLNAMLVSLLCALRPDQLKLIIIDPKRLEFAAYDGIAHLLFPIVTDTKKAVPILKWVVQTMEQRYETMAGFGVRNLGDYQAAAVKNKEMQPMPFIVVIIDELADLMMTAGKAVEDSIARIAQMARAAGIHMIIATQRPSVDVITGMIKVNLPNRIAFKVTSKIDSRTILDAGGAEKLLGRGDMLFLDGTKSHLVRVHGAYISDQEIKDVVEQIKRQGPAHYLDLQEELGSSSTEELLDGDDELYQEVIIFIQDLDEVSISMLQRRFRIGYNRSARIISLLESKGLIMSVEGGKTRKVIKS